MSSTGFANSPDTGDINTNPCLSTDPDIGDSAFWASKAVEQFADAKFTDAVSTVDACFAQWGPEAGQQQKKLHKKFKKLVPFVVKISPDNSSKQLESIANLLLKYKVDGVIATNTTIDRRAILNSKYSMEEGGLSGAPLNKKSTNVIKYLNKCLNGKIPIIGVGGIISANDGIEKIKNGASLIQIYTGLIFRGHGLVNELRKATR